MHEGVTVSLVFREAFAQESEILERVLAALKDGRDASVLDTKIHQGANM